MKTALVFLLALGLTAPLRADGDRELLKDILLQQETQLRAAQHDLDEARKALEKAEANQAVKRGVGIVLTGAGIAGLVVSYKLLHRPLPKHAPISGNDVVGAMFEVGINTVIDGFVEIPRLIGGVAAGAAGVSALGGGAVLIVVAGSDVPQWRKAVEDRLQLVTEASQRVARLKERLGN